MRIRRQTVEHPFGTLKAWMGSTHFLMRTMIAPARERGQRVVHARRNLLVVVPRQHAIGFQILKWLNQQFVVDALHQAFELAVTLRVVAQENRISGFHLP